MLSDILIGSSVLPLFFIPEQTPTLAEGNLDYILSAPPKTPNNPDLSRREGGPYFHL